MGKVILKTVLLVAAISALAVLTAFYAIDCYKTYQGKRLFFQQYYEQHKEDNK